MFARQLIGGLQLQNMINGMCALLSSVPNVTSLLVALLADGSALSLEIRLKMNISKTSRKI